jgi:hypothetical protein
MLNVAAPTLQDLQSPTAYPPETRQAIEKLGALGLEIANRWMLGWPKRVKGLLATGEYLEALTMQHEQEARVLSEASNLRHLARHEIAEMYGLAVAPPVPTTPNEA